MTRPAQIDPIARAYQLESVLRVAFEAAMEDDGRFGKAGGSAVLEMAADMAGEIINELELREKAQK